MGGREKKSKREAAARAAGKDAGQESGTSEVGRGWTLSIAVPGSIVEDVGSLEIATAVCSQVARVASAYCVDEVVVYDDGGMTDAEENSSSPSVGASTAFVARLLQYLETPPYLQKQLCPAHPDLDHVDKLPPLVLPHHVHQDEWARYRDGIVLQSRQGKGSFVDAGLDRNVFVPQEVATGLRVTLDFGEKLDALFMPEFSETMVQAKIISPDVPLKQHGLYRGFRVRLARCLNRVFKECPYREGYLSIGTSVNGVAQDFTQLVLPKFKHVLVVFGGHPKGLAEIMENETAMAHKTPEDQFNMYFNVCPGQGTKVVRTEDALPMALSSLMPTILKQGGSS